MAHKQETGAGVNISDDCMRPDHELELTNCSTQKGSDRMEGVLMISNRHSQQVEVASYSRHSSGLAEDTLAASAARLGPKKLESSGLEAFRERRELLTHQEQPDLVGTKLPAELSDTEFQQGMDLCRTTSNLFKLSGISSRTCRICNKQFTSGRALGGHMRVHGPLFTQASASSMRSLYAMNSSQRDDADADDGARVDRKKEEGFTSSVNVDTLDHAGECEDDFSDVPNAPSSAQASSGQNSADKAMTFCNNSVNGGLDVVLHSNGDLDGHAGGAGEEDDLDLFEGRSLSLKSDLIHASIGSDEAKIDQGSPAARKSPLYKLRHNPKRSRWFIEQDFAFEAPKNSPGKNPFPVDAAQGRVCSECGKSFPSERALFGHLRCHPDREYRRGVLLRESSSHEQPAAGNMARHRRKGVLVAEKLMKISQMQIGLDRADDFHMKGAAELDVSMGTQKDTSPRMNAGIRVMDEEALADGRAFQEQDRCINSLGVLSDDLTPARWQTAGRRSRRKVGVISKAGDMEIRETSSSTPEDEPALTSETISLELGSVEEQEIETPDCLILLAEAARKIEEEAELLAISTEKYSHLLNMDVKRSRHHQVDASDLSHEHDDGEYADVPRVQDDPRLVAGDSIIRYECTTCKKSFNSHQALGGHRASHKKTKGCFARTGSTSEASDEHSFDDEQLELNPLHGQEKGTVIKKKKKQQPTQPPVAASAFKGHACSICHRVFLTGQALGGHKRCHWTGEKPSETSASVASTTNKQLSMHSEAQSMVEGGIDLNMPAPMDELDADEVGFVSTDQLHVINSETADEEFEVGRDAGSLDLVLGSSALARAVKDLWKDADTRTPSPQRTKLEAEVRRRFDGIWGQHWPNNIGVTHPQLHQPVYAMESLV